MVTIASMIPPAELAALAMTAQTEGQTKRLVKELNEEQKKRRAKQQADEERLRREADELVKETKRLSEGGRPRRAAAAGATAAVEAGTGNVFNLYREREARRQQQLAERNGGRP